MKVVPLTRGKVALVSDADYPLVRQFSWCALRKEYGRWYAQASAGFPQKRFSMHRLLAGFPPFQLDHKDGDGLNNRRSNLRPATGSQNCANRKRHFNNRCGFKGVVLRPGGRYEASIKVRGAWRYLGRHNTPALAHQAYLKAASLAFGEFARAA